MEIHNVFGEWAYGIDILFATVALFIVYLYYFILSNVREKVRASVIELEGSLFREFFSRLVSFVIGLIAIGAGLWMMADPFRVYEDSGDFVPMHYWSLGFTMTVIGAVFCSGFVVLTIILYKARKARRR